MHNPIFSKKVYAISYFFIWILVSMIQMSLFLVFYEVSFFHALTDNTIFFLIHSLTGIFLWYPIRFNLPGRQGTFSGIAGIIVAGIITISIWYFVTTGILGFLFGSEVTYRQFLDDSRPYRLMSDVLVYIALIFGYTFIQYNLDLAGRIENESRLRGILKETELNMLKAQINPHFLFNALNSLSLLSVKDPARARDMIIKLSDFLRYSLRFGKNEFTLLREELENMEKYLEIEKVRFGEKLIFDLEVGDDLLSTPVPSMILQPLLENAVKHGVYESTEPIHIILKAERKDGFLMIGITNEYDPSGVPARGTGIGLKNTRERLKLIYGSEELLKFTAENSVFSIRVLIPIVN